MSLSWSTTSSYRNSGRATDTRHGSGSCPVKEPDPSIPRALHRTELPATAYRPPTGPLDPVPWSGVYLEDMDTPATSAAPLTIGQLATAAQVNTETIRYYERRRLLPEPPRTPAGYRQYDRDAVRRVRFIKRAQDLGFTLKEIDELLALQVRHGAACDEVEERVRLKIARVEEMMGELARVHRVLTALGGACRERRPTEECPILEVLDHDELTDE